MTFRSLFSPRYRSPIADRVQLLILQPTPFCNISCGYCYLPHRDSTARLSRATFRLTLEALLAAGLVNGPLSIVWHAGEPLVLPVSYYQDLFSVTDELSLPRSQIRHSVQTNAILLTDSWCQFISAEEVNVGVSLDGPAFLHDLHRKDRAGRGTHSRVMKGINLLQNQGIDFHVIAVVTADALGHADEIFDFFVDLGVKRLGFNVEELEGENRISSLGERALEGRIREFWERLYERQQAARGVLQIREFERARAIIENGPGRMTSGASLQHSSQVAPFAIISVDHDGNFSTFSPELLGTKSIHYGDFIFGNVRDFNFRALLADAKFRRIASDIAEGVRKCERSCEYFGLCGAGAPSNKYFENQSFASTDTMYCRTTIQMPVDIVLSDLERTLHLKGQVPNGK